MKESLKVDDSRVVHQAAIERSDFPNQRHADGDGLNISCRRSQCSAAMGCVIPEADHYVEHNRTSSPRCTDVGLLQCHNVNVMFLPNLMIGGHRS